MGRRDRSSTAMMRSVLGGLRTRLGLGGDDKNEMQGSNLDGGNVGARPAVSCQDRSSTCTRRWILGVCGLVMREGWAEMRDW